jgi:hypothetical protein
MTPNEVRRREDLPPKPGGDDLRLPLNQAPAAGPPPPTRTPPRTTRPRPRPMDRRWSRSAEPASEIGPGEGRTLRGLIPYNSPARHLRAGQDVHRGHPPRGVRPRPGRRPGRDQHVQPRRQPAARPDRVRDAAAEPTAPDGLRYEVTSRVAADVRELLARGDLRGSSFTAFPPRAGRSGPPRPPGAGAAPRAARARTGRAGAGGQPGLPGQSGPRSGPATRPRRPAGRLAAAPGPADGAILTGCRLHTHARPHTHPHRPRGRTVNELQKLKEQRATTLAAAKEILTRAAGPARGRAGPDRRGESQGRRAVRRVRPARGPGRDPGADDPAGAGRGPAHRGHPPDRPGPAGGAAARRPRPTSARGCGPGSSAAAAGCPRPRRSTPSGAGST